MKSICKIAVSGGAASGKSSVCKFFTSINIRVINLDNLSREVVLPGQPCLEKIVDYFGKEFVMETGELNRPLLRQCITESPMKKKALEDIVQPEIFILMHNLIDKCQSSGEQYVVVEVPLLFELGLEKMFDANILVCIGNDIQIQRLMKRDSVTKADAKALLNIQMPQAEKRKRAEFVVENTSGIDDLLEKTKGVFNKIVEKNKIYSKSLDM